MAATKIKVFGMFNMASYASGKLTLLLNCYSILDNIGICAVVFQGVVVCARVCNETVSRFLVQKLHTEKGSLLIELLHYCCCVCTVQQQYGDK